MQQIQQNNPHIIDNNNHTSHENINVRDMPDPHDIYSAALGASDTSQSFVHIPNVRDGDGDIILPQDYKLKLKDNTIVMVNVYLKLYVFSINLRNNKKFTLPTKMDFETQYPKQYVVRSKRRRRERRSDLSNDSQFYANPPIL